MNQYQNKFSISSILKDILKVFLSIIITLKLILLLFVLGVFCMVFLSPGPEKPEIPYGEFPFKLVYEINGERIEIDDVLVIEHLGQDWNEGSGKYNEWHTFHMKGTKAKNCTTLDLCENSETDGATITFFLGSCEYYMGLEETSASIYKRYKINPGDIVVSSHKEFRVITEEELYDKFGIKIIEKSVSMPLS